MLLINEKVTNTRFATGTGDISTDKDGIIDVPQELVDIFLSSGFTVVETKKTTRTKTTATVDTKTTEPVTTTTTEATTTTTDTTTTTEPTRRRWRRKNDD